MSRRRWFITAAASVVGLAVSPLAAHADTVFSVTETHYDVLGRPDCVAVRMNPATFSDAPSNACVKKTTEGDFGPDRITKTFYDAASQPTLTLQAFDTPDQRFYATYTYTLNGRPATVTDANGNLTQTTYDGFDRVTQQNFPSTTRGSGTANPTDYEQYGYDSNDNRVSLRKRDGSTLAYGYDALNRMVSKSGSNTPTVTYDYNTMGRPTATLFAASGQGVTYSYDGLGRKLTEASYGKTISFCYGGPTCLNADKINPTRITWPDGNYAVYAYDNADRQTSVAMGGAWVSYVYDNLGRRSETNRANGVQDTFTYDPVNRLKTLSLNLAGADKDQTESLDYNPASQVTRRTASNSIYQWGGGVTSLTATADGLNRDQALATIGGGGCAASGRGYDCNGDLTNDGSRTFAYDGENRLTAVNGPVTATLSYDPLGRLRQTTINGTVTQFLYDGDQLIAEYDGSGNLLRRYMHGMGTDDPLVWFEGSAFADPRYLHADRQGSIIAWSNGSGVSQATYTYGPYGEPGDYWWTVGSRFRYTGQAALSELKLYHYKARMYDPMRGWFLQTDPIGYGGGLHWYAYVDNNPVNANDSTGECPWCVPAIIGAAVGGAWGGGVEYMKQRNSGQDIDWGKVAMKGAAGAGAGLVSGATGAYLASGLTLVYGAVVANAVGGSVGGALGGVINECFGDSCTLAEAGKGAAVGAVVGGVVGGAVAAVSEPAAGIAAAAPSTAAVAWQPTTSKVASVAATAGESLLGNADEEATNSQIDTWVGQGKDGHSYRCSGPPEPRHHSECTLVN